MKLTQQMARYYTAVSNVLVPNSAMRSAKAGKPAPIREHGGLTGNEHTRIHSTEKRTTDELRLGRE